ncbi:MAG: arginine--tRNA ligase [Spirochaetaceae bacterium]|nr:arginine--tRNA ligase [Spirochaetaceae bacterium]
MLDFKNNAHKIFVEALKKFAQAKNVDIDDSILSGVVAEDPPKKEMGDVGIPCFTMSKIFRMAPAVIATEISKIICDDSFPLKNEAAEFGKFFADGPYVNVALNRSAYAPKLFERIESDGELFGAVDNSGKKILNKKRIMIEFSSPNTNKPLHLGHLRNDALGESISRILLFAGAEVYKVCIINNRGVHICKSMLAYKKFHEEHSHTPENCGVKSDRFVGDCYVEFENYRKAQPEGVAEEEAQSLLRLWESGDEKTHQLWKTMNDWAISGIKSTYDRTGVSFDKFYFESDTYLKGKDEVLRGLKDGIFTRKEDGSVQADLSPIGLDTKILLRKDGTSLYITQDLGTAIARHEDWPFDRMIYVVGNEQNYHFKVLFYLLKSLGYTWSDELFHLSYGMVNLPDGKMKSREGTVVDADDLIDGLRDLASGEIIQKGRENEVENISEVSEKIAIGALHYFLLQATPEKDMLFDPRASLSFNGNTGPYLQYTGARMCSIFQKIEEKFDTADFSLLTSDEEWALIKTLSSFPGVICEASEKLNPSLVAGFCYELAKNFAVFYHECPVATCKDENLRIARVALMASVQKILKKAMDLILVPFLEKM